MVDPVSAGIGLVSTFVDKFVKDKNLAQQLQAKARSEEFQGNISLILGQQEINKVEAAHKSIFVAGWRPWCGWVCGLALAYNFIIYPIMKFIVVLAIDEPPELPVLNFGELMPVLLGMLGLTAARTYEKEKGVASDS